MACREKQGKRMYTKICIIKNCVHFIGTRSPDVKMFRVPTDNVKWRDALVSHADPPFRGLICYMHFHETDLIAATKCKAAQLKKNVIPTIFDPDVPDGSCDIEIGSDTPDHHIERTMNAMNTLEMNEYEQIEPPSSQKMQNENNDRKCYECKNLKVENELLRQSSTQTLVDNSLLVAKLEDQIRALQRAVEAKKNKIQELNGLALQTEKSNALMQASMREQTIISKEGSDVLKVCMYIPCKIIS